MRKAIALLLVLVASCAKRISPPATSEAGTAENPEVVSPWNLQIDSGRLNCEMPSTYITLTVPGQGTYAINGSARSNLAREREGWRDLPEIEIRNELGAREDVSPIIDRGLKLCEQGGGSVWISK